MLKLPKSDATALVRLLAISVFLAAVSLNAGRGRAEDAPGFERDVQPIFARHCFRCHGQTSQKAELNLSSAAGLRAGGESGPIFVAGKADDSLLYRHVLSGEMPPEDDKKLSDQDIATIAQWIKHGARFSNETSGDVSRSLNQHDVLPILYRRCVMCHGPEYQQGKLDVRSKSTMIRGGTSGPAIVPGKPAQSLMVARVRQQLCPPQADLGEAGIEPMTSDELATISRWIASGARVEKPASENSLQLDGQVSDSDRDFWSFQPPRKPPLPAVARAELVRTPIDRLLLSKLESSGMSFAAESDRATLLRRATFDLTGLPPTPAQVSRFLADDQPQAYERLIDRLLASPAYGEKWGRFWLDLAGYADSEGKRNADMIRPFAYRYRDYVIQSFNADKPYDTFLVEQLAGDELIDYAAVDALSAESINKLVATGFLRMAPDGTSADPVNRISDRVEVIADEIDVVGRGLLGLTLQCARCHSHKYDPIPQRDYYRFVAIFKGAYDQYDWLTPQPFGNQWKMARRRHLAVAIPEELQAIAEHNAPLKSKIAMLRAKRKNAKDPKQVKKFSTAIKKHESQLRAAPQIRALWDRGRPSPTYVYRRGVETQPGRLVEPGVPSVLAADEAAYVVKPPRHSSPKTGRRLAFARWLVRPNHPLTARVFVNRIWHQHFGRGIVESLDNFGKLGTPPSHPELLDWLAVEFMRSGWRVKPLHRLIMTSTAYRQASAITEQHRKLDPTNHLLSRMPMRRLRAEEIRDSILLVADRLSERPYGVPDQVEIRKDGLITSKQTGGGWRRSIYVRHRRKEMPTILETFDLPQMNPNCTQRRDSTVVSQPLHLLHNKMIYELSRSFADRIQREAGQTVESQVARACLLAFSRPATTTEIETGIAAINQLTENWRTQDIDDDQAPHLALADFCHVLLNSANFLYVD